MKRYHHYPHVTTSKTKFVADTTWSNSLQYDRNRINFQEYSAYLVEEWNPSETGLLSIRQYCYDPYKMHQFPFNSLELFQ